MYFVLVLIVGLFYFILQIGHLSEVKRQKYFCFFAFLVILFVHLFKDDSLLPDLATDAGGYRYEFELISEMNGIKDFFISFFVTGGYFHEIGWSLLNYTVSRFTNDFGVFQKIVSFGICAGYSYGIYKLSKNPLFSFLFLMLYPTALYQSFYVLRQHLATAVFMFFIPSIINGKTGRVLLGLSVAASLHYSALILAPFYLLFRLGKKPFSAKRLIIILIIMVGFTIFLDNLSFERYADNVQTEKSNTLGLILTGSVFILLVLSGKLYRIKQSQVSKYDLFMETFMLYSVIICWGCLGSATGRLTNYFTSFLSVSIPYAVWNFDNLVRHGVYAIVLVLSLFLSLNIDRGIINFQLLF